jgi:hypothetical protein
MKMTKSYYVEYDNIFLVEEHKWALYCWEKYRKHYGNIPSRLVHLDYHSDSLSYEGNQNILKKMNLNDLYKHIEEDKYIRLDSFIVPAILRGYIKYVDFYCFQSDDYLLPFDYVPKKIHRNIESLVQNVNGDEIILDIDLDLFNHDGDGQMYVKGNLWKDEEIKVFIEKCTPLIKHAKVITIAQSPGFTGDINDIEHLTELVIPMILNIRKQG